MALWDKISSRGNVQDRRGLGPLAIGGGTLGVGGILLVMLLNYLGGGNITDVLEQLPVQSPTTQVTAQDFQGTDSYEVFVSTVLGSTNDYWTKTFAANNVTYTPPTLVLFRGATQGGCGISSSAVGPHYCPADHTIYLDETFFDELRSRFGGNNGDVAQAYVIAHEVGHHAQNLLGIMEDVLEKSNSRTDNELSVKQELQADCFAGLWANSIKDAGVFEQNEIQEALGAAAAVGDDRIQQKVEGQIDPETWTHGSSEQRTRWFTTGFTTGSLAQCNTLSQ